MHKLSKRLLAAFLSVLLAAACLGPCAAAEGDWRDMLRSAFGLSESADSADDFSAGAQEPGERVWSSPIIDPQEIVDYLDAYGELPENFITKKEAQALGWDSRYNYVGEIAPGMSIGGDRFGNYEGLLPKAKGRTWYECDANYKGKKRGAERVLFSSDGLYYYTNDHYETFTEMFPEEWP